MLYFFLPFPVFWSWKRWRQDTRSSGWATGL